jgi:hypothetical protein
MRETEFIIPICLDFLKLLGKRIFSPVPNYYNTHIVLSFRGELAFPGMLESLLWISLNNLLFFKLIK